MDCLKVADAVGRVYEELYKHSKIEIEKKPFGLVWMNIRSTVLSSFVSCFSSGNFENCKAQERQTWQTKANSQAGGLYKENIWWVTIYLYYDNLPFSLTDFHPYLFLSLLDKIFKPSQKLALLNFYCIKNKFTTGRNNML